MVSVEWFFFDMVEWSKYLIRFLGHIGSTFNFRTYLDIWYKYLIQDANNVFWFISFLMINICRSTSHKLKQTCHMIHISSASWVSKSLKTLFIKLNSRQMEGSSPSCVTLKDSAIKSTGLPLQAS